MLQSGLYLPPAVVSRAWCPVSYQGYRYIPTFPVPWLPHFWPEDVNLWPQYLLPFRRTFAAVETNQRLPGIKMSVNELDSKIGGTLKESTKGIVYQTHVSRFLQLKILKTIKIWKTML